MIYEKITHLDLFSGIGGFALATDRVFGNVEHVFCDNEPFAQEVLKKHWPQSFIYSDIRDLNSNAERERLEGGKQKTARHRGQRGRKSGDQTPFILTGGFPCQPFSQAGRRRGEEDDRFLWPEMCRVIGEFKPTWVIAENVRGLLTQGGGVVFERVCTDLEALGYEVQPIVIPAVAVGAPHRRDRIWFIGNAQHDGRNASKNRKSSFERSDHNQKGSNENEQSSRPVVAWNPAKNAIGERGSGRMENKRQVLGSGSTETENARPDWTSHWLEVATRLCRVDDGLPRRLDRNPRLKALGNAIVPQVAEEIMRAILYT